MTQQSNINNEPPLDALDIFRPPNQTQITSYDLYTDGELETYVTPDDPISPDELPENAERASYQPSITEYNTEHTFVVVHRRRTLTDTGTVNHVKSGILRLLAPVLDLDEDRWWETDDTFDTWQDTEAFIATHFDQPDSDNEYITPMPTDHFMLDISQTIKAPAHAPAVLDDANPETDVFTADAINPDQ